MIAANKGVKILSVGLQPYAPESIKGFDLIAFTGFKRVSLVLKIFQFLDWFNFGSRKILQMI